MTLFFCLLHLSILAHFYIMCALEFAMVFVCLKVLLPFFLRKKRLRELEKCCVSHLLSLEQHDSGEGKAILMCHI